MPRPFETDDDIPTEVGNGGYNAKTIHDPFAPIESSGPIASPGDLVDMGDGPVIGSHKAIVSSVQPVTAPSSAQAVTAPLNSDPKGGFAGAVAGARKRPAPMDGRVNDCGGDSKDNNR